MGRGPQGHELWLPESSECRFLEAIRYSSQQIVVNKSVLEKGLKDPEVEWTGGTPSFLQVEKKKMGCQGQRQRIFSTAMLCGNMHWTHVVDRASCASGQTMWLGAYQTHWAPRKTQTRKRPMQSDDFTPPGPFSANVQ